MLGHKRFGAMIIRRALRVSPGFPVQYMTTIQAGAEPRTALPGGRGVRRSELTIITVISEISCCALGSNVLVLTRSAASSVRSGKHESCPIRVIFREDAKV